MGCCGRSRVLIHRFIDRSIHVYKANNHHFLSNYYIFFLNFLEKQFKDYLHTWQKVHSTGNTGRKNQAYTGPKQGTRKTPKAEVTDYQGDSCIFERLLVRPQGSL